MWHIQGEVILTQYIPLSSEIIAEAQRLFIKVVVPVMTEEHFDEGGASGAILNMRDHNNDTRLCIRGGTAPEDKFRGYGKNASAKNDALEDNPKHKTSWQVHCGDMSKKPYPGAIRTSHDDRISISGFTWQRDTIGSLWIACKLKRISIVAASKIAEICGIKLQFLKTVKKLNTAMI